MSQTLSVPEMSSVQVGSDYSAALDRGSIAILCVSRS